MELIDGVQGAKSAEFARTEQEATAEPQQQGNRLNVMPEATEINAQGNDEREQAVASWLREHPEFFHHHQALLGELLLPEHWKQVPEATKEADSEEAESGEETPASMSYWLRGRMERRLDELEDERTQFIESYRANTDILRATMDLSLAVMSSSTVEAVDEALKKGFHVHFKVSARLLDISRLTAVGKWAQALLRHQDIYYSEQVSSEMTSELRSSLGITISSFVLARIPGHGQQVLVLASEDPTRYSREANRDSLFLDYLCQVIAAQLSR